MTLVTVTVSERSKLSAVLSVTFPMPTLPAVPPLPTSSVPGAIMVMPM